MKIFIQNLQALIRAGLRLALLGWLVSSLVSYALPSADARNLLGEQGFMQQEQEASDARLASISIPLNMQMEQTLVGAVKTALGTGFDPEQVWQWPAQRFSRGISYQFLHEDERWVVRLRLSQIPAAQNWYLYLDAPRLDSVHMAWRIGDQAWQRHVAGDRLAMNRWSLADRQPVFALPTLSAGQSLDVVLEIAHRGGVHLPVFLQNERQLQEYRVTSLVTTGMVVGLNLALVLLALIAYFRFKNLRYFSVVALTTLTAWMVIANTGVFGVVAMLDWFEVNDQIKFVSSAIWFASFPIAVILAANAWQVETRWWIGIAVLGAICPLAVAAMLIVYRDFSVWSIPLTNVICILLGWTLMALLRRVRHLNPMVFAALCLQSTTLLMFVFFYLGWLSTDVFYWLLGTVNALSCMGLLFAFLRQQRRALYVQDELGKGAVRDELTGLLNYRGLSMEYKPSAENSAGALFFIELGDAQQLSKEYGILSLETGLVQVASMLACDTAEHDFVARISETNFVLLMHAKLTPYEIRQKAQLIYARLLSLGRQVTPVGKHARIAVKSMVAKEGLYSAVATTRQALKESLGKRIIWVNLQELVEQDSKPESPVSDKVQQVRRDMGFDSEFSAYPPR